MDTQKTPADRIRPVLKAMERSIDQARRKRMNHGPSRPAHDQPSSPPALHQMLPPLPLQIRPIAQPQQAPMHPPHGPQPSDSNGAMRLKAKPKRAPSSFFDSPMSSSQSYRTAG